MHITTGLALIPTSPVYVAWRILQLVHDEFYS